VITALAGFSGLDVALTGAVAALVVFRGVAIIGALRRP
jgi:hypothetical protein